MKRFLPVFVSLMFWSWQVNAEQPVAYAILDCKLTSFGGATIDKHEYVPELDDDEMHNFQALIIQDPSKKQTQIKTVLFSSNIDLVSSEKNIFTGSGSYDDEEIYMLFKSKEYEDPQQISIMWVQAKKQLGVSIYDGECTKGQVFQ